MQKKMRYAKLQLSKLKCRLETTCWFSLGFEIRGRPETLEKYVDAR